MVDWLVFNRGTKINDPTLPPPSPPPLLPPDKAQPLVVQQRNVLEQPYYFWGRDTDTSIAVMAVRPNQYQSGAAVYVNGLRDLSYPVFGFKFHEFQVKLHDNISRTDTTLKLAPPNVITELSLLAIENELMQVTSVVSQSANETTVVVDRAVHDTVPTAHKLGEAVWRFENLSQTRYTDSTNAVVSILTTTGINALSLDQDTPTTAYLSNRPLAPLNVANIKINDNYQPTKIIDNLTITYAGRNRLTQRVSQRTLSWYSNVTEVPEENTVVHISIFEAGGLLIYRELPAEETGTFTITGQELFNEFDAKSVNLQIAISTVRDGVISYDHYETLPFQWEFTDLIVLNFNGPGDVERTVLQFFDATDYTVLRFDTNDVDTTSVLRFEVDA